MNAAMPSGHDRPRERAARLGVEALSDAELLAILLVTAGPLPVAADRRSVTWPGS